MKFHFYIKKSLSSVLGLFLFFSATMIDCTIGRGNHKTSTKWNSSNKEETITDGKGVSSETGVTHTEEVPFVEETVDEVKERESRQPPSLPKQRVIPFQKMPPPKELPKQKDTKPDQKDERDEEKL